MGTRVADCGWSGGLANPKAACLGHLHLTAHFPGQDQAGEIYPWGMSQLWLRLPFAP